MNLRHKVTTITFGFFLSCQLTLVAQVPVFEEVSTKRGIADVFNVTDLYGNGAAAADFDNDGDIDFYMPADFRNPDRLYRNDGKGNFTDIALESGIVQVISNRAALWFDYNGDHRLDLVVVGETCVNRSCENPIRLILYRQNDNFQFEKVTEEAGLVIGTEFDNLPFYAVGGLAAADINQDHFLDLLLTVWGGGIKLFQNKGDGSFSDITEEAGLSLQENMPWQPMFHDFNNDGLIDIYCNIDFAANKLWLNRGGVFEDKAVQYGLNNAFNEMGMTISDYDNDGDLDIYVTNITREYQGQDQYNIFYEQQKENGRIIFREIARGLGVSQSGWDWGTTFIDINNDGRQDLITTNGWLKLAWEPDPSKMWLNTRSGFVDVSEKCGFNDVLSATTLLTFDMDRDGDMDILQTLKDNDSTKKPLLIYENRLEDLPNPFNYVTILPRMDGPNQRAIGSVVTLVADKMISSRLISAGSSFYGQEPAEAFFGLGRRNAVKEIIVKWPGNEVSIYQDISINQTHTLLYDFVNPPTHLTAEINQGRIDLSWRDNSDNESGFVLHRSEDSTFADYQTVLIGENVAFYTDIEVEAAKKYFYRIRGYNSNVLSDNSNIVSIRTNEAIQPPPTGIFIYPNPVVNNRLIVQCNTTYKGPVRIRLFDLSGRAVLSEDAIKETTFEEFNYSIHAPSGMYLLQIKMGDFEKWQKVAVVHNQP